MDVTALAPAEVHQRIADGNGQAPVLLDVRSPAEYETAHIPGSHNLPLDRLDEVADQVATAPRDIVVLCQSGPRSEQAQRTLAAAGARTVHVLDGGLQAWERDIGEVRRGRQRWALERQVRLVAGALVLSGVAGSALVDDRLKYLAGAVGGGLTFAALSNTCMMGNLLSRLPFNRGAGADVEAVCEAVTA